MKQTGFSLIELMIVILIIGILASVAVPSYNSYVIRSSRIDGMTSLQNIMRAQIDFSANEFAYTINLTDLNFDSSQASSAGRYRITAGPCGSEPLTQCIRLTATPLLGQASDGPLTLDSRGNRTHNGNDGWPK